MDIIDRFFTDTRQTIADDGFTERVMRALPEHQVAFSLRRYSLWLNILCVVSVLTMMIYLGFFTRMWEFLQGLTARMVIGAMTFDYDGLLVQVMLFLHRLPEMLPSVPQLTTIVVTIIVLMTLGINRVMKKIAGSEGKRLAV